ncbi:hypothetical protein ABPG74_001261 [Tetrahymena malaccensis]
MSEKQVWIDLENDEDNFIQKPAQSQIQQDSFKKNGNQNFNNTSYLLQNAQSNKQNLLGSINSLKESNMQAQVINPMQKSVQMGVQQNQSNYNKSNNCYNNQNFRKNLLPQTQRIHNINTFRQQKQISNKPIIFIDNDDDEIIEQEEQDCIITQHTIPIDSQQESSNINRNTNSYHPSNQCSYEQKLNQRLKCITPSLLPRETLQNTNTSQKNIQIDQQVIDVSGDIELNFSEIQSNNVFSALSQNNKNLNTQIEQINQDLQPANLHEQIQQNAFIEQESNFTDSQFDQTHPLSETSNSIKSFYKSDQIGEKQNLKQQFNSSYFESNSSRQNNEQSNYSFMESENSMQKTLLIQVQDEKINDQSQMAEVHQEISGYDYIDEQQLDNQNTIDQNFVNIAQKQNFSQIDNISSSQNKNTIIEENLNLSLCDIEIAQNKKKRKTTSTKKKRQNRQQQTQEQEQEESFQLEGFSWKINSKTKKKYIKKNSDKKLNQKNFQQTVFSDFKENTKIGKEVHKGIESYLQYKSEKHLKKTLQNENDVKLIVNQIKTIHNYLLKRGMETFNVEIDVQSDTLCKRIDYLAYSVKNLECIIVDWKFNKAEPCDQFKDSDCHFQQQIIATQYYLQNMHEHEFKVTLLIVPLKYVEGLKIIEYNLEDIKEMQKDLFKSKTFQQKKIKYLKADDYFLLHQQRQCTLEGFIGKTLLEIAQTIIEQKVQNTKDFDFFNNLENAKQYQNYLEQSNYQNLSRVDQFYLIHILINDSQQFDNIQ